MIAFLLNRSSTMPNFSTNEFKPGLKVMLDGDPCSILENEFVKPGKGQAFNRVKLRNLKSGRVWERTFKSGDTLEGADVMDVDLEYSYSDGEFWHFMDPSTYEQYGADRDAVGEAKKWLKEQERYACNACKTTFRPASADRFDDTTSSKKPMDAFVDQTKPRPVVAKRTTRHTDEEQPLHPTPMHTSAAHVRGNTQ